MTKLDATTVIGHEARRKGSKGIWVRGEGGEGSGEGLKGIWAEGTGGDTSLLPARSEWRLRGKPKEEVR